jgi:Mn-containing catalase
MTPVRELLVEEMQDLLHAETQLVAALPKMAQAAQHPKLREAFEKHLTQTEGQVERLQQAFELLGTQAEPKACKGMQGLIAEGQETIAESSEKDQFSADLALIAAAQKVEHYEISGYGTARTLARQIGEKEVAALLSRNLGEEESADFLLTEIAKPILQQVSFETLETAATNGKKSKTGKGKA